MRSEEYTQQCNKLANDILAMLDELHRLMVKSGDEARAMDINEAKMYVSAAVEE